MYNALFYILITCISVLRGVYSLNYDKPHYAGKKNKKEGML